MTDRYKELLGVCSHELYHTWNIKAIRPVEMFLMITRKKIILKPDL